MLDARFVMAEVCEINNNELAELDDWDCFLLGVEWGIFYERLKQADAFSVSVSPENVDRLTRLGWKKGRRVRASTSSRRGLVRLQVFPVEKVPEDNHAAE